jgi:hypothetical protein
MQQQGRRASLGTRVLRGLVRDRRVGRRLAGLANSVLRAVDAQPAAYQPVDVLGIDVDPATRERIIGRWDAMRPVILAHHPRTALDIGAAEGFYAMRLAELGLQVIALEAKDRPARILSLALSRARIDTVGQLRMTVTPDNVSLVPSADVVLLLAVWHHWVRNFGLDRANEMLRTIWSRTGRVLVFETGEHMPTHYGLPDFGQDPSQGVSDLLTDVCPGSEVRHLGRFPDRSLFAVVRPE